MKDLYLCLLIITRAALVYRVLEKLFTFLLFNVRVRDFSIRIWSMKITARSANRMISLSFDLQRCQIQVQTCFRLLEIKFLISIILGMTFCTRTKTILLIERDNIQLDFFKRNALAQTSLSSSFTINFLM